MFHNKLIKVFGKTYPVTPTVTPPPAKGYTYADHSTKLPQLAALATITCLLVGTALVGLAFNRYGQSPLTAAYMRAEFRYAMRLRATKLYICQCAVKGTGMYDMQTATDRVPKVTCAPASFIPGEESRIPWDLMSKYSYLFGCRYVPNE
jgi:hypothetical protein